MKRLLTSLCILPLGLASMGAALAQTPAAPAAPAAAQTTTNTGSDAQSYIKTQEPRMAAWRKKIKNFNARVATKTTQAGQAAKADLEAGWGALENASTKLSAVGAEGWSGAKATYERAASDMEALWAKYDPAKS